MPILTKSGRVVIAESVAARSLYLAWGRGDGAWLTAPDEGSLATSLMAEVGRRVATEVTYAVPDVAGDIVLPTGRFTRSSSPTNHLFVNVVYDFADASSEVIREIGLFSGPTMVGGLPGGQQYFVPANYATPGRLLHLENLAPIYRSPSIRPSFEIVITF